MEELQLILEDTEEQMGKAITHLENELSKIRAGKASPDMLSGVMVDYYGVKSPINQTASVNTQDAKTLVIKPFDKSMLQEIEKGILAANIGVTPQNDGDFIRIVLPPLTEERRRDLVKSVNKHGEETRVSIRNIRRDAMHQVKDLLKEGLSEDLEKDAEQTIQKMTDEYTEKVNKHLTKKEEEIMKV